MSIQRVFGGINGMYGTGIQQMVMSSDRWDSSGEIGETYINNMGAVYGNDKNWGQFQKGLLRATLVGTDIVVQPRQSNVWGALSLDHVYEFMGGINLAVRTVNGKEPMAYFADYRNRHNFRMQELQEAIGVEARSTVFNPAYIKEVLQGNASSAERITEVVTNTFAWNVMKPAVIDKSMWEQFYSIYVEDKYKLGVQEFFRRENPFALQEVTAVMLESVRKGLWQPTQAQAQELARLHTELVRDFGASGRGFSGSNAKLQQFIADKLAPTLASEYKQSIANTNTAPQKNVKSGITLTKEEIARQDATPTTSKDNATHNAIWDKLWLIVVALVLVGLLVVFKKKRKG
jgi:cobaltochelatase CobN